MQLVLVIITVLLIYFFQQIADIQEILHCLIVGNPPGTFFPESVRMFCLCVHFHSPSAYNFIREVFGNNLPHPHTIQKWYSNSDVSSQPGITEFSLNQIKRVVQKMAASNKKFFCSIIFDEMHIKKNIQWYQTREGGKFIGCVTYGHGQARAETIQQANAEESHQLDDEETGTNEDQEKKKKKDPMANQAIVFLLNGINDPIQLPIAFHFISSLDSVDRASLLAEVLKKVTECGAEVVSVTFDGFKSNKTMAEHLGAKLSTEASDLMTKISIPVGEQVLETSIILDPSHMIKLVRNNFAGRKVLYAPNGKKIEWKYIELLYRYHQKKEFKFSDKISKRHIQWMQNKMNVRLAVQTLSDSVANSIEFLMRLGIKEFENASETIQFIRHFNTLFDTMNSRSKQMFHNQIYKRPLHNENKRIIFDFWEKSIQYISSLRVLPRDSKNIGSLKKLIDSEWQCGFRGFIISMKSLKAMYVSLVEERAVLDIFPTFCISQDPLECLFGKFRRMNGCNDNPNCLQFTAAYRKLLAVPCLKSSSQSNCEDICYRNIASNILKISSSSKAKNNRRFEVHEFDKNLDFSSTKLHEYIAKLETNSHLTMTLNKASIAFIASKIEKKILTCDFYCEGCKNVFTENHKISSLLMVSRYQNPPTKTTFEICKVVDVIMESLRLKLFKEALSFQYVYYLVRKEIGTENLYPESDFTKHSEPGHLNYIINLIIDEYLQFKTKHFGSEMSLDLMDKILRPYLYKQIHQAGQ